MGTTRLQLRVSPGAARASVLGRHGEAWKVRVAAPAEGGRANVAVVSLLAEALAIPRAAVTILSGRRARDKVVGVGGLAPAELERRLHAAAAGRRAGAA